MEIKNQATKEFAIQISTNTLPGKHQRGSDRTIRGYINDLELFANWFKERTGLDLSAKTLTSDDIQDHITYLQTVMKRKPSTILRRFAAIRAYCLYLLQTEKHVTSDLTIGIRLPKHKPSSKRGLRRLERLAVGRVFTAPWKDTQQGRYRLIRDKAIIFSLMHTGLRVEELSNVTMPDILYLSKRRGAIVIPEGKGNKSRKAGIPSKARMPLLEWIKLRKELGVEHEYLFTRVNKGLLPLKVRSIQHIVEETRKRAGLGDVELSAHILRHTAVRIWRKETDDRTTAAQMGHSVATMQRYDALKEGDVLEAAEKF
jgi:site-specific recombinase XerD